MLDSVYKKIANLESFFDKLAIGTGFCDEILQNYKLGSFSKLVNLNTKTTQFNLEENNIYIEKFIFFALEVRLFVFVQLCFGVFNTENGFQRVISHKLCRKKLRFHRIISHAFNSCAALGGNLCKLFVEIRAERFRFVAVKFICIGKKVFAKWLIFNSVYILL